MLRPLLAVFFAFMLSPAFAQDETPTVDLFAIAAAGFADGELVDLDGLGPATIHQVRAGVFQLVMEGKTNTVLFTFTEPETCVVNVTAKANPPQRGGLRVDLRLLTGITLEAQPGKGRASGWKTTLLSPLGGISVDTGSRVDTETSLDSMLYTSAHPADMSRAADTLKARCGDAGRSQLPDDLSVADLLAAIFVGAVEGVPISTGGATKVNKTSEGHFEMVRPDGTLVGSVSLTHNGDCQFTFSAEEAGGPAATARLNANLIRSITVEPTGSNGDLTYYKLDIEGDEGLFVGESPDGPIAQSSSASTLTTGLAPADMETAISRFRAICPGPTN